MTIDVRAIPVPKQKDGPPPAYTHKVKVDREAAAAHYAEKPNVRPLTPAEARAFAENKWPGENPGADALYQSGQVTVISDRELWERTRKEAVEDAEKGAEARKAGAPAAAAAEVAEAFHKHTAHLQQMAADAKGNPRSERRVAEQIQQSAAVGDELKRRGVL